MLFAALSLIVGMVTTVGAQVSNLVWETKGSGDFTGDGIDDLVLQSKSNSGQVIIWEIVAGQRVASHTVAGPGSDWEVREIGEFTGDTNTDIVLQNTVTGVVVIWEMSGASFTTGHVVANAGPDYVVRAVGEFTGDTNTDILLQNTVSSVIVIWEMNGPNFVRGMIVGRPDPPPPPPPVVMAEWQPTPPSQDGYTVFERAGELTEAYATEMHILNSPPQAVEVVLGEKHAPNFSAPREVTLTDGATDIVVQLVADQYSTVTFPSTREIVLTVTSAGDQNVPLFGVNYPDTGQISVWGVTPAPPPPPPPPTGLEFVSGHWATPWDAFPDATLAEWQQFIDTGLVPLEYSGVISTVHRHWGTPELADPAKVQTMIQMAHDAGLFVGLLPTWQNHVSAGRTNFYQQGFDYGNLGADLLILGGDIDSSSQTDWGNMLQGIRDSGFTGAIGFHSRTDWFPDTLPIDVLLRQTGHCNRGNADWVEAALNNTKAVFPGLVVNGEPAHLGLIVPWCPPEYTVSEQQLANELIGSFRTVPMAVANAISWNNWAGGTGQWPGSGAFGEGVDAVFGAIEPMRNVLTLAGRLSPPPAGTLEIPASGVLTQDNVTYVSMPGHTYDNIYAIGRNNITVENVVVDGAGDTWQNPAGQDGIQSGTVQVTDSSNVTLTGVTVSNSPRASFSIQNSVGVTLDGVVSVNSWHLGIHAADNDGLNILNSTITDPTLRIPTAPVNLGVEWESGGMKIVRSSDVTVDNTEVSGGFGSGIWFDIDVTNSVISNNFLHDLTAEGIFVEISRGVVVSNNTVDRAPLANTGGRMNWCYGPGILISTSDQVTVVGNVVSNSVHGITVLDQSWRTDKPLGYDASQYSIDGNTVTNVDKFGACQDVGNDSGLDSVFRGSWTNNTLVNVATPEWNSPLARPF